MAISRVLGAAAFVVVTLVSSAEGAVLVADSFHSVPGGGLVPNTVYQFTDAGVPVGPSMTERQSEGFDGLAVGADGTVYGVTNSIGFGELVAFHPQTGAITYLTHYGQTDENPINGPGGLAVGPDGALYVSTNQLVQDRPTANSLLRYDAKTGAPLGAAITLPFDEEFATNGGRNVAFGADGRAYVIMANSVLRASPTSPTGETFIPHEVAGLELFPEGMAFGPDGNLYVASGDIYRFNGTTGAYIDKFIARNTGGMTYPWDIAFDGSGNLLVATNSDSILKFDPTGAPAGTLVTIPGASITTIAATPLPEPSIAGLAALAAAAALLRRRCSPTR